MRDNGRVNVIGRILDSRVFWVIFSLCAALMLWIYYTSNYGATRTQTFYGVEVTFTGQEALRDTLNLVVSDQETDTVNVTLTGTRRDISQITSADLRAVVNLSNITMAGYRTMSYTISYPTTVNQASIRDTNKSPATIGLQISKLSTVSFPVTGSFEGTTADGYMVDSAEMTFDPANVTFTGPEEELEQIDAVRVVVGRDEVSSSFSAEGNYVLLDEGGNVLEFEDVQADADTVTVTVPVSTIKQVALDVVLQSGGGASAEENVVKHIQPETITVAGDAATLDGLNTIALANINLADALEFPETEYNIMLPNGVECLSGETTAKVSLELVGLAADTFIVTNLSYINAPDGMDASIIDMNKVVTVRAPSDILSRITANNIRVVADLSGLAGYGAGRYRVPTTVYVDGFENAGAVGSYPVYVQLEEEEE